MSKKLLLADDSVVIQKLVGLSFANEDIEIVSTDNGDDAVSLAREVQPDVVLADVVMPGLSGYEVCEAIRQDPDLAQVPVLLLTGTFEAFDEGRAANAGANGQITKPFEAQALVERVNEVMNAPVPVAPAPVAPTPVTTTPVTTTPVVPDAAETIVAPIETAGSSDLFDSGVDTLSEDLTPALSTDQIGDPNETSGLFGAPGDGASDALDTEGGNMALGQVVGDEESPDDATIAFIPDAPLPPISEMPSPTATDSPAPSEEPEIHDPLPAARPVDLDAALHSALDTAPADDDTTIVAATDDVNATTSPSLDDAFAGTDLDSPGGGFEDLTVHVPSADIDQDVAAAPSPDLLGSDALAGEATIVADLDAALDGLPTPPPLPTAAADSAFGAPSDPNESTHSSLATPPPAADSPAAPFAPSAPPSAPNISDLTDLTDDAEATVVQMGDRDPLGLSPTNVPNDDFAFDVSEQVAPAHDPMGDSFSSLMDISESQILDGVGAEPSIPSAAPIDDLEPEPAQTIVAGYDVSTSDLVTASGDVPEAPLTNPTDSAASFPTPEPLVEVPELPQSYSPPGMADLEEPSASAVASPITGGSDLFDDLETGSPYEDVEPLIAVDPEDTYASAGALEFGDDLLDPNLSIGLDDSLDTGEPAPLPEADAPVAEPIAAPEPAQPIEAIEIPQSSDVSDADFSIGTGVSLDDEESARRIPDLSPMMEQRIQETLEKVAWEAFSDLSESIVKQVMGRVEQIAWEVIPEMAETLVREEIRKMKGDDE